MKKLPYHKRIVIARKVADALLLQRDIFSPRIEISWASSSSQAPVGSSTLNVVLYNGEEENHLGFIELIGFNDSSPMIRNCGPSFQELQENQGLVPSNNIPIWSVYMAYLKEEWRGKKLGKLLYQKAIETLRSQGSFFMVPWSCLAIGGTTGDAQRIWKSLKSKYPHSHNNVLFIK